MAFEFRETMAGSYHMLASPSDERPISFTIRARARSWRDFLRRPEVDIEGEVDAEGFADNRRLRGTLGMDVLRTRTLPYAFEFTANDGRTYVFEGKKTLHAGELTVSMTVLPGSIRVPGGEEIARAVLRFDLQRQLGRFLRSFRASP